MDKLVLLILTLTCSISMSFAQPIVKIWNSEDSLAILQQVSQYLDYLDVREDIYIHVSFSANMPEKMKGWTTVLTAPDTDTYYQQKVIKVRIDARLNKRKQYLALAHEMIHVKQYAKEELRVIDQHHVVWKERTYSYLRPADRRYAPWEHEAYRNDGQLVNIRMEHRPVAPVASYTSAQ